MQIPDVYTGSRIRIFPSRIPSRVTKIPDPGPGYASKNSIILTFLTQKFFLSSRYMIQEVHHGSRISDPGFKKAPDPGSRGQKAQVSGSATLNLKLYFE
jgi:hypothetical protein